MNGLLGIGTVLFLAAASGEVVGRWQPYELLILAGCVIGVWLLLRQRRRAAILHAGGVAAIGRRRVRAAFAWADVARMEVRRDDAVTFIGRAGEPLVVIDAEYFGSQRKAAEFAAAALDHARTIAPWLT